MSDQKRSAVGGRIPCLDGLRALSIGLVWFYHGMGTWHAGPHQPHIGYFENIGVLGVQIFFVISGFLITTLMITEDKRYGAVSLPRFYYRRFFRIFPAFYVYIAALLIAEHFGHVTLRDGDLLHTLTYTTNYHYERAWEIGHTWSLSIEEQFYVLWPLIILVFGLRRGIGVAALYVLIAPVVRVGTWYLLPEAREGIGQTFQTSADSLAVGCVLAWVRPRLDKHELFCRIQNHSLTPLLLFAVIFVLGAKRDSMRVMMPVGTTVLNVSIGLLIDRCVRKPDGRLGRFLELRPLAYIGMLSYSLYLWQQPFLNRFSKASFAQLPQNLLLAIVCALLCYYLIEKPFLRLRQRLSPKLFAKRERIAT